MRRELEKEKGEHLEEEVPEANRPKTYAVLPYMHGVTERLQRVFKKHSVSLYSKAGYTVRNAVVNPKDPLDMVEQCG